MKKVWLGALAALLLWAPCGAAELRVDGLGTLPLADEIRVTDGAGTAVETMLRRGLSRPAPQGKSSKRQELMRFLTVPEGMRLMDGTADSPAARVRIYQLVREEERGTYTMMAFAFSGTAEEIFPRDKKRAAFWERAFDAGQKEIPRADNTPMITLDEFRAAAKAAMNRGEGEAVDFQILEASPWKRYANGDGTVRWQQQVKLTVENREGLLVPMWLECALFRNEAGRFHFLVFSGSHESGRVMADALLVALHGVERGA